MDESTGAITQLQAVDRETQDKFNMTAYAYNAAGKRVCSTYLYFVLLFIYFLSCLISPTRKRFD